MSASKLERSERINQEKKLIEDADSLRQELNSCKDLVTKLNTVKEELEKEVADLKGEINTMKLEVESKRDKHHECVTAWDLHVLDEKIEKAKQKNDVLEKKIERLMINKHSIEKENAAKAKVIEEGTALVKQLQRSQTELEHALQRKDIELNVCNDELKTIQECVKDMKWQLQEGKENYTNLESTVNILECESKDLQHNIDDIANTLKEKEKYLSDRNEKLREIEIELLKGQTILDDVATQNQNLEEALKNKNKEINRLMLENCQLEKNLKEMKEQMEIADF